MSDECICGVGSAEAAVCPVHSEGRLGPAYLPERDHQDMLSLLKGLAVGLAVTAVLIGIGIAIGRAL